MRYLLILRRISQTAAFVVFSFVLYSPWLFKADPLVMFVTSVSERVLLGGIGISLILCAAALILGRFFCGWFCPLGALFDFFRLFYPRRKQGAGAVPGRLSKVKFIVLFVLFLLAAFGLQAAWILDPLVIAARFLSLNVIPAAVSVINSFFVFLIRTFNLYGGFYDLYRALKGSVLGVNTYYFSHSLIVLFFTVVVILSSVMIARLWCRIICPLGAGYGLLGRLAFFRRRVSSACNHCNICQRLCRMGAIAEGGVVYDKKECVLCMDCIYDCPQKAIDFGFKGPAQPLPGENGKSKITRGQFLLVFLAGLLSLGAKSKNEERTVIRPPGALKEGEFLDRCIRCGNCMKVCITNGLQPCLFESGAEGIWTPRLVPEIGYCEYHCTLCGRACPTGAITPLTEAEKLQTPLGLAVIDRSICLPWAEGKECIVCEEHCPIPQKAIKLFRDDPDKPAKPEVDYTLCVGCGICQAKCPLRPVRAIRVSPL